MKGSARRLALGKGVGLSKLSFSADSVGRGFGVGFVATASSDGSRMARNTATAAEANATRERVTVMTGMDLEAFSALISGRLRQVVSGSRYMG